MNFHPKKTGRSEIERPVSRKKRISVATVLFLVAGIAISATHDSSTGGSDGGAFERVAGLVADDSAEERAAQGSGGGAALGVRAGWRGAIGKGDRRDGAGE
jgi:hypothetical protein